MNIIVARNQHQAKVAETKITEHFKESLKFKVIIVANKTASPAEKLMGLRGVTVYLCDAWAQDMTHPVYWQWRHVLENREQAGGCKIIRLQRYEELPEE